MGKGYRARNKELDGIDLQILELKRMGESQRVIAKEVGICTTTVQARMRTERFKKAYSELKSTALQILQNREQMVMEKMVEHVKSEDPRISVKACSKLLDKILSDKIFQENKNIAEEKVLDYLDGDDVDNMAEEMGLTDSENEESKE